VSAADDEAHPYVCMQCFRKSYHPRDAAERYCAACNEFEDTARELVRLRMMQAARRARGDLWAARGGLQMLSLEQAQMFGSTMGSLDYLLKILGGEP
jgi:hypothetical protein